jgi:hypothetical protein
MSISQDTFIGSVFRHLGLGLWLHDFPTKYPAIDLAQFSPGETLLLCSTEPFPFGKKKQGIERSGYAAALVDGESFSWFGVRNLLFLEKFAQGAADSR